MLLMVCCPAETNYNERASETTRNEMEQHPRFIKKVDKLENKQGTRLKYAFLFVSLFYRYILLEAFWG